MCKILLYLHNSRVGLVNESDWEFVALFQPITALYRCSGMARVQKRTRTMPEHSALFSQLSYDVLLKFFRLGHRRKTLDGLTVAGNKEFRKIPKDIALFLDALADTF